MALVTIEVGSADRNQPLDILYCAEFHHLLEHDTTFVFCETLLLPRTNADYLAIKMHWPEPPDSQRISDAIKDTPEYRRLRLRSLIEDNEDDLKDSRATGLHVFQRSFFRQDLPLNGHYQYPFSRIEPIEGSPTVRWWGVEASAPHFRSQIVTSAESQEVRLWPVGETRIRAGSPMALRFGAFMAWQKTRPQGLLKFLPSAYNIHFLTGHATNDTHLPEAAPGRLFLKCDPAPEVGGVSGVVKNLNMSIGAPSSLSEPHTTIWVLMPSRWRATEFPVSGTGFEEAGAAKWVLFSYGAHWEISVSKWNAHSSRKYRAVNHADLPLEDHQALFIQRGSFRVQERLGTLISSLAIPAALKALAGVDSAVVLTAAYLGVIAFQWLLDATISKLRPSRKE